MSDAVLLVIAAIVCAAFGGPLWATLLLAALAVAVVAVANDRHRL